MESYSLKLSMKLSFIIPAHNEEKHIGVCLASIIEAIDREGNKNEMEIIVANNASTDNTKAVALSFPGVQVFDEMRKGTNWARQRGFVESHGERLVFLDADTRVPEGWLTAQEKIFAASSNVVCLSGPYKYYDGPWVKRKFVELLWWLSAPLTYRMVGYMVLGGNMVMQRSALEAIGGFDTQYVFYGDDTEVARRLSTVGKVVFRMDFFMWSSYRRFENQGLIKLSWLYMMNFLWGVFFKRPYSS